MFKSNASVNPGPRSAWPLFMIIAGVLLIAGASIWFVREGGLSVSQRAAQTVTITEDVYASLPRVSLGDALAAYQTGTAVFVDVRDTGSYNQSHIKGALSIPLGELPDRLSELKASDWIITYCT